MTVEVQSPHRVGLDLVRVPAANEGPFTLPCWVLQYPATFLRRGQLVTMLNAERVHVSGIGVGKRPFLRITKLGQRREVEGFRHQQVGELGDIEIAPEHLVSRRSANRWVRKVHRWSLVRLTYSVLSLKPGGDQVSGRCAKGHRGDKTGWTKSRSSRAASAMGIA